MKIKLSICDLVILINVFLKLVSVIWWFHFHLRKKEMHLKNIEMHFEKHGGQTFVVMVTSMLTFMSRRLNNVPRWFLGKVAKFGGHGLFGWEVIQTFVRWRAGKRGVQKPPPVWIGLNNGFSYVSYFVSFILYSKFMPMPGLDFICWIV